MALLEGNGLLAQRAGAISALAARTEARLAMLAPCGRVGRRDVEAPHDTARSASMLDADRYGSIGGRVVVRCSLARPVG